MNIVFMGTPDFAVPCIKALVENNHNVLAVYSQPDRPKGRGYKLTPPPVKEYALQQNIKVFQPDTFKDEEVLETLKQFSPDLIVVVAYGKLLPKSVLDIPKYGCVNVHGSILPKYRGAAPIQWSVLNGDEYAGVTTMFMAEGLDTGDIIEISKTKILENETSAELYDRLSVEGAKLLINTVNSIKNGTAIRTPQDDTQSSYAPMLNKQMSDIDFTKPAKEVHNLICGLSDWPCASTTCFDKQLKIYKSKLAEDFSGAPGEVLDNKRFIVACGDNKAVEFVEVQLQGSKRMDAKSFLLGRKLTVGKHISEQ